MITVQKEFEEFLVSTFGGVWYLLFTDREINHMRLAWEAGRSLSIDNTTELENSND